MSLARGRLVTIEGGEGVGKTSLIASLTKFLKEALGPTRGLDVTREPGGTALADAVRKIFAEPPQSEDLTITTEALLVSASRAQHVEKRIRPNLERGTWVLCDRFADSTRVYQGSVGGLKSEALEELIRFSTAGLEPDLSILLDCPVELTQERIRRRRDKHSQGSSTNDGPVRYDSASLDWHRRVREGFLKLAEQHPQRIRVVDASGSIEATLKAATQAMMSKFSSELCPNVRGPYG